MNIAEKLAETVKSRGVQLAYGEPIEADDATLIPIAVVGYGFGGGADAEDNGGGGGGGMSIPLGIYAARGGTTRFHPNPLAVMMVSIPLVLAVGCALGRILKVLR